MENERDDQSGGKDNSPSASEDQNRETMHNQGSEGSFGGQSSGSQSGSADSDASSVEGRENAGQNDGTSGQPIGGNDTNTGTGTTLTQGADFAGQSATGQTQPNDGRGDTLATDESGSSTQSGQRGPQGEGFIGSQGSGSDEYLQDQNPSGADATGGSDFANQGRGALDKEDESDDDSTDDGGSI